MAVTTRGGLTVPDLSVPEIYRGIAAHEARHTAAALLRGLKVTQARADPARVGDHDPGGTLGRTRLAAGEPVEAGAYLGRSADPARGGTVAAPLRCNAASCCSLERPRQARRDAVGRVGCPSRR